MASIKVLYLSCDSGVAKLNNSEALMSSWAFLRSSSSFIDSFKAFPPLIVSSVEGVASFPGISFKLESLIAWVTAALWSSFKYGKSKAWSLAFLALFVVWACWRSWVNVWSSAKLGTLERSSALTSLMYFSFSSFER